METSRRNSSLSSITTVNKTAEIKKQILVGACTFAKFIYGGNLRRKEFTIVLLFSLEENQSIILNSYSSCRRLLDHLKPLIGVQQEGITFT